MNINNLYILLQVIGTLILVVELIYVVFQKPSNLQKILCLLLFTCIVSFVSYYFELKAKTLEAAYFGCVMGYLSKPYSLITVLLFLIEYSHIKIKKKYIIGMLLYFIFLSLTVFTNEFHNLYYTSVNFDPTKIGSGLLLGHGIFWYTYMISSFILFVFYTIIFIKEFKKSKTKQAKAMAFYIFLMLFSGILGLLMFVLGFTGGYDTTLAGTFVGSIWLLILLYKYRLFDSLTLSKDKTINEANFGIIVFDGRTRLSYSNEIAHIIFSELNNNIIDDYEFENKLSLIDRNNPYIFGDRAYRVELSIKTAKQHNSIMIGKTYVFHDITEQYTYQNKLEHSITEKTFKIKEMQREIIMSFANIVEARDGCTGSHIKNVAKYVSHIAKELSKNPKYKNELDSNTIIILEECAPLHDIGKIYISDTLLNKPGKLTIEEFDTMKTHTLKGVDIIGSTLEGIEEALYVKIAKEIALSHHEWYNGYGYPKGLKGNEIPLSARIMAVSDVYDALRAKRPYKDSFTKEKSINIIKSESGSHFDPDVVEAFLNIVDKIDND